MPSGTQITLLENALNMATKEARTKAMAPPEKPEYADLRSKVVISFWAVILLLGLPTWYKTTEIYRASLPLEQMIGLSEGEVCAASRVYQPPLTSPRLLYQRSPSPSGLTSLVLNVPTPSVLLETYRLRSITPRNQPLYSRGSDSSIMKTTADRNAARKCRTYKRRNAISTFD
jgi:hypothetical protein